MRKKLGDKSGIFVKCVICQKSRYIYPYLIKKGYGKYCSHRCYSLSINKGDDVGYPGLHAWVRKEKGKAIICEWCFSTKAVQWANKSHVYKRDLDDWLSLCKKCHVRYDDVLNKSWKTRRGLYE